MNFSSGKDGDKNWGFPTTDKGKLAYVNGTVYNICMYQQQGKGASFDTS